MALIRGEGEREVTPPVTPMPAQAAPTPQVAVPSVAQIAAMPPASLGIIRASPAARKRAGELGVDLQKLVGTGAGGAITLADVEKAAGALPSAAEGMRQAIGAAMARSKREIPHYYLAHTVDLEPALRWLEAENAKRPPPERILYGVLLLKAVARVLREYPEFNGFWINGRFQPSASIHLGVAISIGASGLIAPAIHDADGLSLSQLMAALRDLVGRARRGRTAELGAVRFNDHRHESRRAKRGKRLSRDLSAAGRHHRLWHGHRAPMGCRESGHATTRHLLFARGRPPRERRPPRRPLSRGHCSIAPGATRPMTDQEIRKTGPDRAGRRGAGTRRGSP